MLARYWYIHMPSGIHSQIAYLPLYNNFAFKDHRIKSLLSCHTVSQILSIRSKVIHWYKPVYLNPWSNITVQCIWMSTSKIDFKELILNCYNLYLDIFIIKQINRKTYCKKFYPLQKLLKNICKFGMQCIGANSMIFFNFTVKQVFVTSKFSIIHLNFGSSNQFSFIFKHALVKLESIMNPELIL